MKIASHLDKFHRLDAATRVLDPQADAELWIWAAMNAATNLLNAALHHVGATEETDSFHTQSNGLYLVPDRATGTMRDVVHPPGDVMHWGQPRIEATLPPLFAQAGERLRALEDLREPHVRGSMPIAPGAEQQWRRAYHECVDLLATIFPPGAV